MEIRKKKKKKLLREKGGPKNRGKQISGA